MEESFRDKFTSHSHIDSQIVHSFSSPYSFTEHAKKTGCCNIMLLYVKSVNLPIPNIVEHVYNSNHCIITTKEITKGSGLINLANHLNISLDDILIAGDDYNDIDMFRISVGWKIAVGDKCLELSELSTSRVDSSVELNELLQYFLI